MVQKRHICFCFDDIKSITFLLSANLAVFLHLIITLILLNFAKDFYKIDHSTIN